MARRVEPLKLDDWIMVAFIRAAEASDDTRVAALIGAENVVFIRHCIGQVIARGLGSPLLRPLIQSGTPIAPESAAAVSIERLARQVLPGCISDFVTRWSPTPARDAADVDADELDTVERT